MIQVNFKKERAEHFVEALQQGQPIEPTRVGGAGAFVGDDLLALAAACLVLAAENRDYHFPQPSDERAERKAVDDPERLETWELFEVELEAAVDFARDLVRDLVDGAYDYKHTPSIVAKILSDEQGRTVVERESGH